MHTARIIAQNRLRGRRRHEIHCQLRQSLVAGLAIQLELYGTLRLKWSSVSVMKLQNFVLKL